MAEKKERLRILLKNVRLSFPHLDKPQEFTEGQPGKYNSSLLIPKDKDITDLKKLIHKAKVKMWGNDKAEWPKLKTPTILKDGDENSDLDGYAGNYIVSASSKEQPVLMGPDKSQGHDVKKFYPGCYVHALIDVYAYEYRNKEGKVQARGVAAGLVALQIDSKNEGERFGGGGFSADEYDFDEESSDISDDEFDEEDEPKPAKNKKSKKASLDDDEDDFDDSDSED